MQIANLDVLVTRNRDRALVTRAACFASARDCSLGCVQFCDGANRSRLHAVARFVGDCPPYGSEVKGRNMIDPSVAPRLLWTRREAAAALSISERTLWTLTDEKQIPCVRIRRSVRYDPTAIRSWVQAQNVGLSTSDNPQENP